MGINVQTIRSSFELVKPIANQVVDVFYEILFMDFPEAKPLFSQVDMPKQKKALIGSLVAAVENLDKPDPLTKFLLGLGDRHAGYGVEDIHYDWVGASLLKALSQCLGAQWTPDLQSQWGEVYGIMAEAMKVGARNARTKVRSIQREPVHEDAGHASTSNQETPMSAMSLPHAVKEHIYNSVEGIVLKLIQIEVKRCFDEQMQRISRMSPDELVKKAG